VPVIALIAAIVAFLIAGILALSALAEPVIALPLALVPLAAGIGILRRKMWSAYGFALFLVMHLILLPLIAVRSPGADLADKVAALSSSVLSILVAVLFFFAGRSLAKAGSTPGRAWPWVAVSLMITFPLFFFQPFVNRSGSMEDTLLIGDRVLTRVVPRGTPQRGDVIVFQYPPDHSQTFIKRVVGMPGDRVRVVNRVVYRNGVALKEPYAVHKAGYPDSYRDNFPGAEPPSVLMATGLQMLQHNVVDGEVVVPDNTYFVLGDNRDNSLDSRYWGFVSFQELIGKPVLIYDSLEQSTDTTTGRASPIPIHRRWNRLFHSL